MELGTWTKSGRTNDVLWIIRWLLSLSPSSPRPLCWFSSWHGTAANVPSSWHCPNTKDAQTQANRNYSDVHKKKTKLLFRAHIILLHFSPLFKRNCTTFSFCFWCFLRYLVDLRGVENGLIADDGKLCFWSHLKFDWIEFLKLNFKLTHSRSSAVFSCCNFI